jgi:hypothetical protein
MRSARLQSARLRQYAIWIAVLLLSLLALKGLVVISEYVGYAGYTGGRAGTITELVIEHQIPNTYWAAVYGVAVRVAGYDSPQYDDFIADKMVEQNLLFNCLERDIEHEVYAVPEDIGVMPDQIYSMSAAEVDAYYGKNSTDYESAVNTFTQPVSFQYGTVTINTVGTATYKINENPPSTFRMAIARTANGTPIIVALVANFSRGFNNRLYNYQLMLPVLADTPTTYHFYTDPHDICPSGEGELPNKGEVYGLITSTTGLPLENVIVEVAGVTNLSGADGWYSILTQEGTHNIFALKTGYKLYQNNVTVYAGNRTRHDIILEEEEQTNPNNGVGPGTDEPGNDVAPKQNDDTSPAQDVGPGEAPPVPPVVQQPKVIEGQDYIISLMELNRKLRLGQFLQERVLIYSFKKTTARVNFAINGSNISQLIKVDREAVDVEPNGKGEFVLTIFGVGDIGIFNGTIELSGDLNATIPVNIEVLPREQLPVEALHIDVETAEKTYYPKDLVRVKTDLRNMLTDQQYPVHLFYTVQSPDGNTTLWTYETNVFIKTAFSLIKSFELPPQTESGDYILRVSATYLGFSSGTSTIFHVAVPFWSRVLLGLKYWHWLLILLGIAAVVAAGYFIKRNIDSKKKYHLKVDYNELPKPGPRSIWVGRIAETDKTTYFNLENFKTHTIVAGSTGGGKSVSAQVIIEEALDKGVAVLVFDPTAQWSGMLRPCKDKTMLSLYPLFGMKRTDAKAFNGNIRQINDAREKIDIRKYVKPGEIQVFACHKLDPKDMDILVANAIREIFHQGFPEEKLLKVMFVFDEVHRLLPKFGGSGDGFLQIERACREFRKWGLGVMLISQVLSDFVGTIKANINTEIQMRTRDEGDLERIRQKYGEDVLRSLVKATVGSGMVENPAYNRGQPYFVAFKPLKHSVERLSDEEIEQYNTYNDMIDNLIYSLEQLEKEGVDIFDLKLELKLALDKVKTGNFNMVKIYLEGLTPRIDKAWEKLGKQPRKLVRELVNLADIKAELVKAQQEREKYLADQQAAGAAASAAQNAGPASVKVWGWKEDVTPEKILNLKNGMIVINLASLYDEVSAMKDNDLPKEFDPEPQEEGKKPVNRFARWVLDAIGDKKLADNLAAATTKDELLAILEKRKAGQALPDAKPPKWFEVTEIFEELAKEPVSLAGQPAQPIAASEQPPEPAPIVMHPASNTPASEWSKEQKEPEQPPTRAESAPPKLASVENPPSAPVAQAKSRAGIERFVVHNEQEAFRLENGIAIHSVKELHDYLPGMDEGMFRHHVGLDYNHFADWISGVFHDEELADRVAHAQTKQELLAALEG